MKLSDILSDIDIFGADPYTDTEIGDICYDSRKAAKGCLFICIRGAVSDGHLFASDAYTRGCRFFLAERRPDGLPADAVVFLCRDTRKALATASANLFGHPSNELFVIGITGTKGKTTTALLVYEILNACGHPAGYIGSNGIFCGSFRYDSANTTPESYLLQMTMRDMRRAGVETVVMEVSSQALYLGRVHGIRFDVCLFTNLSEDHIGGHEHPSFEHYKNCKKSLFSDYGAECAIVNADDAYAGEFASAVPSGTRIVRFAVDRDADYSADSLSLFRENDTLGIRFRCRIGTKTFPASLDFPGKFSVSNALAAIAICRECGLGTDDILRELSRVRIDGRFEIVRALPYATFIIDYAHNKVSLTSALETLREYNPGRLICLFGSVGGRTVGRRAELGSVAASLADFAILTSDNPDAENPMSILRDIATQFRGDCCPYEIIPDREEAVRYAVSIARPGDIVLLAGKGHERYQLICGKKEPFSERDILLAAGKERRESEATV